MNKTFFITGGGTGGHIYPAVAVFSELLKDGHNMFYVGNKKRLEYEVATSNGYNFLNVDVDYMPRKLSLGLIFWFFKTLFAVFVSVFYILKYKPNCVFATGGYVSAPILFGAMLTNTPYVLHDCDAYPGIVSRVCSGCAKSISLAFESAKKHLKSKNFEICGNPIREIFKALKKEDARQELSIPNDAFVLLIMGGSQGANSINGAAKSVIDKFKDNNKFYIIIQTGKKNYDNFINQIGEVSSNVIIRPYFDVMAIPLVASDLVVSRAGSLSISEICASGAPSILVPYPFASANHQALNAKDLSKKGACVCLEDSKCKDELADLIFDLYMDKDRLFSLRDSALNNAKYDAVEKIKQMILEASK